MQTVAERMVASFYGHLRFTLKASVSGVNQCIRRYRLHRKSSNGQLMVKEFEILY